MASESAEKSHESLLGAARKTGNAKIEDRRMELIVHYRKKMTDIQTIPYEEGNWARLVDIYVQPRVEIVPAQSPSDSHDESFSKKRYIYSYSDLFDEGRCKRAFMSSYTGMGKTTFTKKVVLTWCQAWQSREKDDGKFEEEDVKFMKTFDLLFYIENTKASESDARREMKEIPKKYKCLLILDDVDRSVLDQYNSFENFTILATSRSDIPAKEDEKHVALSLLTQMTSLQLQKNVIQQFNKNEINVETENSHQPKLLSSARQIQKDLEKFDDEISESNLGQLRYVPSFLLQELWLFKYKKPSKNRFEAHKYRIEKMLLRANKDRMFDIIATDTEIPDYIQGSENFGAFYQYFLKLGKMAFEILCKNFTGSIDLGSTERMKNYPSSSEVRFYVRAGILIKEAVFSETTMQEFFAAIYVAGEWNDLRKKILMVQKFLGLPNVMKMNSVLNFVKDMDIKLYEAIYETVINRADLDMYLEGYKKVRVYGGRFLHFEEGEMEMIVSDCNEKIEEIAKGRFGPVYKCSKLKEKYGNLTVKKIELKAKNKKEIMECIDQEWLASRYLHPFLLSTMTILRTVSEQGQTFYLLSHFCELGNLFEALHGKNKLTLRWKDQVRIIFQVALGIDYLHNASRRKMVHRNVCSQNILLDLEKNARLTSIDYSDSRPDDTAGHSSEELRLEDYRKFGVVMAELLNYEEPEDITKKRYKFKCPDEFEKISKLAVKCLKADSSFSLQSDVIATLRKVYYKNNFRLIQGQDERCALCLVNVGFSRSHHAVNCTERMSICKTCENSLCSEPLKCFRCGFEQQVESGKDLLVLLIAGNDKRTSFASAVGKEVENMKKVFTSPKIFDISEENVRLVKPDDPGKEDNMIEKFETAVKELEGISNRHNVNDHHDKNDENQKRKKEKTLLLYYTGHGEGGFYLGIQKDKLLLVDLQKNLNRLNVQKAVIFLDCCTPPEVRLKENITIVQINACRSTEEAILTYKGSLFTGYFVDALIEAATKNPRPDDSSITVFSLLKHCTKTMEKDGIVQIPTFYTQGCVQYEDLKIGRRILEPFKVTLNCGNQQETIPLPRSMVEFETDIFLTFAKGQDEHSVHISVEPDNRICRKIRDIIKASILQEKLTVEFRKLPASRVIKTVKFIEAEKGDGDEDEDEIA